ncbi:leucyl aminopeptidase family protein [Kordiimonas lacus]|uniref:Leucyl aminopeptidase n=1 Tax=Kordiimonas lacus TaxID=637679 RepID=A0A1G7EHU0_9PROT|nr:leucyl aminopeptidase family protein [Kordiimonas lacus]SDE63211.1 leucyl aminopeptidase [Kordiimonas lacus]
MTTAFLTAKTSPDAIPLRLVCTDDWPVGLTKGQLAWAEKVEFSGEAGTSVLLPGEDGGLALTGVADGNADVWSLASAATLLPKGTYRLDGVEPEDAAKVALGWALAQYKFDRYLSEKPEGGRILALPAGTDLEAVEKQVDAVCLARDLVNTPTEDMGPAHLQDVAEALAEEFGGTCATIVGEDLLDENFPVIHAVGRAAGEGREPRLIDLNWGESGPKVTLVGKGVCFDTGGLDLKPAAGMLLMKKDMGGAAHVLALARLIMSMETKVQLRVLIPAVENAVDGNAFRPGDVLATRKGISVEVGNTDAEGRLVLCDALTLACEDTPDLLVDFATLTGAARVALGPDLPATYANDETLWAAIDKAATAETDPVWRMPLWAPYDETLKSDVADMSNISDSGGFAGSITAALYLQRFVEEGTPWVHLDVFAWVPKPKPGRPKGGDAQAIRAMHTAMKDFLSLDG